jgi:hypothetical protein
VPEGATIATALAPATMPLALRIGCAAMPEPPPSAQPEAGSPEDLDARFSTAPPGAPPTDHSAGGRIPLDADDMRGHHFRALFRGTPAKVVAALFVAGAGVVGAIAAGPAIGAAAAAGAALLLLVIAWVMASGRAESDYFKAYASGHSLQLQEGRGSLPPMTPLLRRGDRRYTDRQLTGTLPGGEPGTLAPYTYEESTTDSDGNRTTTYMHFTVMVAEIQEFAPFMQELYAQRRVGFRFLDGAEDIFRKRQRVEHESEVVDKRYEIFCAGQDDVNRARQVLSPQFLVWLQEHSPEAFAFECVAGMLVCNVKGHKKSAAELDEFCEGASAVAKRLREEALE